VARYIELHRHTDNDGDLLTEQGVTAALEIGRRLIGPYVLLVSSGAQRATQTLACFACVLSDPVSGGVIVEPGLRSDVEDRWRAAYRTAGSGELSALQQADPELVRDESGRLADGLRRILDRVPDGGRALAVGHSPTNEAAVFGLTGEIVVPISKGEGVLVVLDGDQARVEPLP
jgi:broad specificity phosphatase PhoE